MEDGRLEAKGSEFCRSKLSKPRTKPNKRGNPRSVGTNGTDMPKVAVKSEAPDSPDIRRLVTTIECDLDNLADRQWAVGDALCELLDLLRSTKPSGTGAKRGWTVERVRLMYFPNRTMSSLSQCHRAAQAFSADERSEAKAKGASFRDCYQAQADRRRLINTKIEPDKHAPILRYVDAVMARKSCANPTKAVIRDTVRQIKRATIEEARIRADEFRRSEQPGAWLDNFFLGRYQEVLERGLIAPKSLTLAWCDPMYPYRQRGGARDIVAGSTSPLDDSAYIPGSELTDDKAKYQAMVQNYLDAIRGVVPLLDPKQHALVVWWGGGELDPPEVVNALYDEFKYVFPTYWRKPTQAGAQYRGFAVSTERVVICAKDRECVKDWDEQVRRGQELAWNMAELRDDNRDAGILDFKSATRKAIADFSHGKISAGHTSLWEKPVDLCEYLLTKMTLPGDLVWDMCGCRATMVEACIRLNRRWFYSEAHEGNYAMGLERVRRLMESPDKSPEVVVPNQVAVGA